MPVRREEVTIFKRHKSNAFRAIIPHPNFG